MTGLGGRSERRMPGLLSEGALTHRQRTEQLQASLCPSPEPHSYSHTSQSNSSAVTTFNTL